MKPIWIIIIILVVLAGAVFFLVGKSGESVNRDFKSPKSNQLRTIESSDSSSNSPVLNEVTDKQGSEVIGSNIHNIDIMDFSFELKTIRIKKGDTIVWKNQDSIAHTVTSDSGNEINSKYLSKGEIYSHTFTETGTFNYHCRPHPYMKATVIVE